MFLSTSLLTDSHPAALPQRLPPIYRSTPSPPVRAMNRFAAHRDAKSPCSSFDSLCKRLPAIAPLKVCATGRVKSPDNTKSITRRAKIMKTLQKLLRGTAVTVFSLGLGAGVVSAAPGTGTISGPTGPDSNNQVTFNTSDVRSVSNSNRVNLRNSNPQDARTGDAKASHNTTAGATRSGDAMNDSLLRVNASINNAASSAAAVQNTGGAQSGSITGATGPDSNNQVTFNGGSTVSVSNNNDICISNNNEQSASSGRAEVSGNTTGGSATSGNASNVSTTEVTLSLTN